MSKIYKTIGIIAGVSFGTATCASTEELSITNHSFSLSNESCTIDTDQNQVLKTKLEPNCYFVKHANSSDVRSVYIDEIKSHVVLLVGDSVKNHPDFPLTAKRDDCSSKLQAIIIPDDGSPTLSKVLEAGVTCAGIGVDEKEFWIISH